MIYKYDEIFLFVKVVEAGSFIGAAKKLKIGQATISRRMQVLEQQLGLALFKTHSKGFELTKNARAIYTDFKAKCEEYDNSVNQLLEHRASPRGTIKASLPTGLAMDYITPYLPKFLRKYPEINLEIFYQNQEIDLIKDGFDIAVINHIPQQQTQKIKLVFSNEFCLYCTSQYKEKYGLPLTPEELHLHNVTGYMRADYSIANKIKFTHRQTGRSTIVDMPRRIAINDAIQSLQMLNSHKLIVGLFNEVKEKYHMDKIKVLPEYLIDTVKYYMLKHPNENKLINQLFYDFIEGLFKMHQITAR